MLPTVLIVDAASELAPIASILDDSGRFVAECFADPEAAEARLSEAVPDAILFRVGPDVTAAVQFTRGVREQHPLLPLIVTGNADQGDEVEEVVRAGATDFVLRPLHPAALVLRIHRCVEQVPVQELARSSAQLRLDRPEIVGSHPLTAEVRTFVGQVGAVSHVSVLLLGEPGTGKNLVARAIHTSSACAHLRFVEVNCSALPSHRLEAELFGYEKGAFSDAEQTKKGLVEVADGGTLFLDEVASLPLDVQTKLLAFLETRRFRRLGSTQERSVKLRVVAATNENLQESVRRRTFRMDLYYRLNVASHVLPPLRQIRSDIPALTAHFAERAARYFAKGMPQIDLARLEALAEYEWPGNARELRNAVERAMIFVGDGALMIEPTIPVSALGSTAEPLPPGLTLAEVERRYIQRTMEMVQGNVNLAAEQLGVSRKVLWQRRRRYGLL